MSGLQPDAARKRDRLRLSPRLPGAGAPASGACRRRTRGWPATSRLLALEGVGNPDNVGGLFRIAAALGAGGVLDHRPAARSALPQGDAHVDGGGAPAAVVGSAVPAAREAIARCAITGYQVAALTPRADAMALDRFAVGRLRARRAAPRLGGSGARAPALDAADYRVRIPQAQRRRLTERHRRRGHRAARASRRRSGSRGWPAGIGLDGVSDRPPDVVALGRRGYLRGRRLTSDVAFSTSSRRRSTAALTIGTNWRASSNCFCSMPSRMPGSVLTP